MWYALKGVVCFGKKEKLAPRFVRPFEIIKKIGQVAYRLDLTEELDDVHDTFHVSNLKKFLADLTLQVPLDEIQVDAKLNFVEEPTKILKREFKKLKRSRIAIIKVRWNSKRGPEFTWEREDQMKRRSRDVKLFALVDLIELESLIKATKDEGNDGVEEEFEEEEEPQEEEEDDMKVEIEEDENEPELTFPYEEVDPLNLSPTASDSEPEDVIKVEDTIEPDDETVPASVHEVDDCMVARRRMHWSKRRGKQRTSIMVTKDEGNDGVEVSCVKLAIAEERDECKKLKKELEEARFSNTLLGMQKERVKRDLYWTRAQSHEFYGEMIRRGVMFEERPNEAIDVPVEVSRIDAIGCNNLYHFVTQCNYVLTLLIMPPKSTPLTQAVVRQMIKESVDAAIAAERVRQANTENNASGSGQARVKLPYLLFKNSLLLDSWSDKRGVEDKKVKFAATTLRGPILTWWNSKVTILGLDVKEYNMVAYTQRVDELALMCPRMVEPKSAKFKAYIQRLCDNIKGEVTSSNPTNLNEAVRMAHKLMEQKLKARNERILEGTKRKWENFQSVNNSGKRNHKDNLRKSSQNNQKQRNARAMTTASNEEKVSSGSLPVCERCFTRHVGQCTIKCHKCGKIGHKARSFVDTRFSSMLDIDPVKIDTSYEVELADERIVGTKTVLKGCTLNVLNHLFEIDLMPIELDTFDIIIGMDWPVKHDALIVMVRRLFIYLMETRRRGRDLKLFALVDLIELESLNKVTKDEGNGGVGCRACDDLVKDYLCVPCLSKTMS
uniref:Putative reverse transcriptase domain-containing protein n=1 Tax=Tanacetum cinerariifolium TaxID=118510 RepID=A0A6L2LJM4_TANCI|nr:putative reverse transcriptase domain-containing protein [Tanacetum cinerariifolium]